MSGLRPCPFCGSPDLYLHSDEQSDDALSLTVTVRCQTCMRLVHTLAPLEGTPPSYVKPPL